MKLAVNYSPPASKLLASGQIDLDYFKCPDWPEMITRAKIQKPVHIHFDLQTANLELSSQEWERIDSIRQLGATGWVNIHFSAPGTLDQANEWEVDIFLSETIRRITKIADRFGAENVLLENLISKSHHSPMTAVVAPTTINKIIKETGISFLLDLSHAQITCRSLGWDEWEYLDQLPTQKIKELHITGIETLETGLQDHLPMTEEDWENLSLVLERIDAGLWNTPELVSFEYGGEGGFFDLHSNLEVIRHQVPRLHEVVRRIGQPIA